VTRRKVGEGGRPRADRQRLVGRARHLAHPASTVGGGDHEAGRDYDAIEKTVPSGFDLGVRAEKVGELIEQLRWLAGLAVETIVGWVVGVDRIAPIEIMGREVIPALAELGRSSGAHGAS
jgi:hypothetical protein